MSYTDRHLARTTRGNEFDRLLGGRVRDLRNRYEWTQQQLAEKLGMKQHVLSRYETGEYGLSAYQFVTLSTIFAITPDSWFVGDTEWQNFVRQL